MKVSSAARCASVAFFMPPVRPTKARGGRKCAKRADGLPAQDSEANYAKREEGSCAPEEWTTHWVNDGVACFFLSLCSVRTYF